MAQKMNILDKLHQEYVLEKIMEINWDAGSKAPLVVEFDSTEVCNLACPGCISEDLVSNKTSFSKERLLELADEMYCSGVKAVILIGGGEPLAHPAIGEFIDFLGSRDVHLGITTNGSFIDRYIEPIAKYSKWTRVSMDAASDEMFSELRPSKNGKSEFEHIISNMEQLAKVKKGKMGFSFLIRTENDGFGIRSNIHEIYKAATLAKKVGCDYFEVKPSYQYVGGQAHSLVKHDSDMMQQAREEINRLIDLETKQFKVIKAINLEDSLNCVQTRQEKTYKTCPVAQLRTLVCPSGVYVCPYWRGKAEYRIGNVHTTSFDAMWRGNKRKEVMAKVDPSKVCNFHCLRNESNKEILEIISRNGEETKAIPEYDRFI